jgi:hypothetical protein
MHWKLAIIPMFVAVGFALISLGWPMLTEGWQIVARIFALLSFLAVFVVLLWGQHKRPFSYLGRKLLSIAREPSSSISTDKVIEQARAIEFYESRPSLAWFREKLSSTKVTWALWVIGESASAGAIVKETRFERLLLLHPNRSTLEAIATIMKRSPDHLSKIIQDLTQEANSRHLGCVRWYDNLTSSLITFDF